LYSQDSHQQEEYNKAYATPTAENEAFGNFQVDFSNIQVHNELYDVDRVTFLRQLWNHSDKTLGQKQRSLNGLLYSKNEIIRGKALFQGFNFPTGPSRVDWREAGIVTPVRDQTYECSSCWAHVTVDALSAQWKLKTGKLLKFSEQNLIDCNRNDYSGNYGCRVSHAIHDRVQSVQCSVSRVEGFMQLTNT